MTDSYFLYEKIIILILLFILFWGCGYQLAGKETHLPPGVNSVAIPTLSNKTLEPGIETHFTQAFLKEFILDRRVKVVDRKEADSILEGTIKSFYLLSISYDKRVLPRNFRLWSSWTFP